MSLILKGKLEGKSQDEIRQIISDAWLNIYVDEGTLTNPLREIPMSMADTPHLWYTYLMTRPEYFSFTVKELFGIRLLPVQALMLKEIWNRRFPMLIACRGFGKMLKSDELIRCKNGWTKIKDLQVGDKVYGGNGKLASVMAKTDKQSNLNMYRITLRDGREIECCEDHMWRVWDKNKNRQKDSAVWSELSTKDMVDSYFWVRKDSKSDINKYTKEYRYALPINKPLEEEDEKKLTIHPYIVGVLLGDGSLTTNNIKITSNDEDIIFKVRNLLPDGYSISEHKNGKDYAIVREDKSVPAFHHLCREIGIWGKNSHTKYIPEKYLYSSLYQRMELIRGLMDTDGYAKKSVIEYYTVSDRLSKDFLNLARSCGIHCKHSIKQSYFNSKRYADCHRISLYTKELVFSLSRKLNAYRTHAISKQGQSKYEKVFITKIEYIGKDDGYCIQVDNEDNTYITKDYIVTHNSFIMAVYALLRALLIPKRKIVICGASFRQSKVIFEYMQSIWNNSPILRDIVGQDGTNGPRYMTDMCRFTIRDSMITALPIGDGQKIRGQRANDIIADEFASIARDIFENVIAGFAAVRAAPADNVRIEASKRFAKFIQMQQFLPDSPEGPKDNQIAITGTAYYDFNHFGEYWKRWKTIIRSRGDHKKLEPLFQDTDVPEDFDWRDYSVIRIPYELVPKGFMDEAQVARSKATIHSGIYQMEFGAVFSNDSNGFFKRTLVESCVVSNQNEIYFPSSTEPAMFSAAVSGNPQRKYIYGIDPASEVDNFSIVILEQHPEHRRIVHCWTTNRKEHKEKIKANLVSETDFYSYCARKIRDLMKIFPTDNIALDAQGGGISIMEALHDDDKIDVEQSEQKIWPIVNPDKPADTDGEQGLHILHMIQFASADWTSESNHGMRKDFEDKVLLFPFFDMITLGVSRAQDELGNRLYDTLEDCVLDIEELKDELSTIIISQTPSGRDKWDTPEIKLPGGKKGRQRKDRYSALVMANAVARDIQRNPRLVLNPELGGWAENSKIEKDSKNFVGPAWLANHFNGLY